MSSYLKFCDTIESYEDAKYVILGVPFDSTVSFRPGEKLAPNAIRQASYNAESLVLRKKFNLKEALVYDMGDLDETHDSEEMIDAVYSEVDGIVSDGKFPILLGGEHSISIGAIKRIKKKVLFIDAHTDFRNSYMGNIYSHASVARRAADIVGKNNILSVGIRSVSKEEIDVGTQDYISSYDFKWKRELSIKKIKDFSSSDLYFSIDVDGIDPAYAPGVGTPEPFGLSSWDMLEIIDLISNRIIALDIVEITPLFDNGNTAFLAARLIQEIIASRESSYEK